VDELKDEAFAVYAKNEQEVMSQTVDVEKVDEVSADVEEKYEVCGEQSAVAKPVVDEEEEEIVSITDREYSEDQVEHLECIKTESDAKDESFEECLVDGKELEFQEVSEAMRKY
jgi:hypothetical protein